MDRILIADDESEIRSLLRLYLENAGYAVEEAADGEEAVKLLADYYLGQGHGSGEDTRTRSRSGRLYCKAV